MLSIYWLIPACSILLLILLSEVGLIKLNRHQVANIIDYTLTAGLLLFIVFCLIFWGCVLTNTPIKEFFSMAHWGRIWQNINENITSLP